MKVRVMHGMMAWFGRAWSVEAMKDLQANKQRSKLNQSDWVCVLNISADPSSFKQRSRQSSLSDATG